MNIAVFVLAVSSNGCTTIAAEVAEDILKDAGVAGGLVIHVGCGDGQLTTALHVNDRVVVHGLDTDVSQARETIRTAGVYGPVSAQQWSGVTLPYADNLARLVVVSDEKTVQREEILRVLCPGGIALIAGKKLVKPWPESMGQWPQHFHGADNNAVSSDTLVGPPRRTQWIAAPQWSRAHLILPSIHSMVSSKGRLFTIEDQASAEHPALPGKFSLICRDAFSGVVLWQNRFPDWHSVNVYIKFTPAQLQRQLAAIGDIVYATPGLDAPITAFDAASGKTLRDYPGTERVQEFAYDQGVLFTVIGDPFDTSGFGEHLTQTIGASAFPTRAYGPVVRKLERPRSEIRAVDAESGKVLWSVSGAKTRGYEGTSLAVRGTVAAYCTSEELACLDRETGAERWRVPAAVNYTGKDARFSGRPGYSVALVLSDDTVYLAAGNSLKASSLQPNQGWSAYRHDAERSGCTKSTVSPHLKSAWSTKLTTRGSAPVIAGGTVFVADVDAHAVCALDSDDGRERWCYVTGGRVDSPPTLHQGMVLFGSRDGGVYAVRANDGALVWRFQALPDRLICAFEQLESTWPVSGSILVKDGIVYFTAGRNSFLDGGIFLFGLDPLTGSVIHQRRLAGPYDEAGFPKIPNRAMTGGFGLEGHKGDILLADDRLIYLRHQAFEPNLTPVDPSRLTWPHLITSHGFTESVPHHRSFWTLDTTLRYDIPTGAGPVHGDILVKDGSRFYEVRGYKPGRAGPFDPRLEGYRLFAGEISPVASGETANQAATNSQDAKAKRAKRSNQKKRKAKMQRVFTSKERWSVPIPLTGKALAKAGDVLFVAGTPVAFPEDDLAKAYEGRMGGMLWAVSTADGRKLAEYKLDAPPVWDSLAAANGRLFLCTTDGRLHCFAE